MKVSRGFIAAFLLPAILLYLIFFLIPTAQTIYYSFFDWSGVGDERTFIGLDNYLELKKTNCSSSSQWGRHDVSWRLALIYRRNGKRGME